MAKRKRRTNARGKAARAKQQAQRRLLGSAAALFLGLLLLLLAFVEGQAAWHTAHDVLFGLFGAGSFVLGPAVCYMAVLAARLTRMMVLRLSTARDSWFRMPPMRRARSLSSSS